MRSAAERREETDGGAGRRTRAALPGFGDGDPGSAGEAPRPQSPTRKPPPEEAAAPQPPELRLPFREPRRAWPWPWPSGAGAAAAAGVTAAPAAAAGAEADTQKRQLSVPSLALTHVHTPEGRGRGVRAISGIEINNKVHRVREEGLIDVEGLAGVSHSPAPRGGVRGTRRSSSAAPWPRPLGAAFGSGARARAAAGCLACFLLCCCCSLTLFSWLECGAALGRLVGY